MVTSVLHISFRAFWDLYFPPKPIHNFKHWPRVHSNGWCNNSHIWSCTWLRSRWVGRWNQKNRPCHLLILTTPGPWLNFLQKALISGTRLWSEFSPETWELWHPLMAQYYTITRRYKVLRNFPALCLFPNHNYTTDYYKGRHDLCKIIVSSVVCLLL